MLNSTLPLPEPELVIEPMLLGLFVDTVIPLPMELLLLKVMLPVPEMAPEIVKREEPLALLLVNTMLPAPTVMPPPTVSAEVVLFSIMPVTLLPTATPMVVVPDPDPMLVIVPELLRLPVAKVTVPEVALSLIVRLLEPVTPPLKVVEMAVPLTPSVKVPVVVEASAIGLE